MSHLFKTLLSQHAARTARTPCVEPSSATQPSKEEEKKIFSPPPIIDAHHPKEEAVPPPLEQRDHATSVFLAPVPKFVPDVQEEVHTTFAQPRVIEESFEPAENPLRTELVRHVGRHSRIGRSESGGVYTDLPVHLSDELLITKVRFILLVYNADQFNLMSHICEWTSGDDAGRYFYGQLYPSEEHGTDETSRALVLVVNGCNWGELFLQKPEDVLYQLFGNRFEMLRKTPKLLPHIVVMGAPYAIHKDQLVKVFERHIYLIRNLAEARHIFGQLIQGNSPLFTREQIIETAFRAHRPCLGCGLSLLSSQLFSTCTEGHDICLRCSKSAAEPGCPCNVFVGVGLDKRVKCTGTLPGEAQAAVDEVDVRAVPFNMHATTEIMPEAFEEEEEEEEAGTAFDDDTLVPVQMEDDEDDEDDDEDEEVWSSPEQVITEKPRLTGKRPASLRPGKRQQECRHQCDDKFACKHKCCKRHLDHDDRQTALLLLEEQQTKRKRSSRGRSREKENRSSPERVASPPRVKHLYRKQQKKKARRDRSPSPESHPMESLDIVPPPPLHEINFDDAISIAFPAGSFDGISFGSLFEADCEKHGLTEKDFVAPPGTPVVRVAMDTATD